MRSASVWLTLLLLSCVAVPSAVLAQESDLALLAEKLAKKLEKHRGKKLIVADFSGPKSETTHLGRELADELSAAVATQNPSIEVLPRSTSVVIFTDPAWGFPEEILLGRDAAALAVTSEAELVVTGELQVKRNQLELTIRLWEIPLNSKETLILLNSYPLVRHKAKLALTEARRSAWEKLLPSVEKGKRRISAGFRWPQSSGEEQAAAASADTTARQEN
ncbi:MAG TPA: FlgO family outer membrane protein, partial [Candidatus Nitrosotenuis sp.]|nr:FlgO family outer membrane protein [Candidatus Nitrosotenuis sp.]